MAWSTLSGASSNSSKAGSSAFDDVLIAELSEVLWREKFSPRFAALQTTPDQFLGDFRAVVEIVEPSKIPPDAADDPDDVAVLACAVGGQADCIITGDDDLLRLESYQNIPIWTARQFCDYLEDDLTAL